VQFGPDLPLKSRDVSFSLSSCKQHYLCKTKTSEDKLKKKKKKVKHKMYYKEKDKEIHLKIAFENL
jgi:hypothetical protein